MQKNMYFDYFGDDCFAAVTEGGRLVEFHLDTDSSTEISGNIYKGRVVNVLSGMQAAFVAFGQEKNGYLYAGDIPADADISPQKQLTLQVKEGDEVMVQVAKSPIGSKGARLSMCLSFVGKNIIFLPKADFCAVSRKITDEPLREKLLRTAEKLAGDEGGIVMRTNAVNAKLADLRDELKYLRGLYATAKEAYASAAVGEMVYRDADVHARLLRDFDLSSVDKIYIADEKTYLRAEAALRRTRAKNKLVYYRGEREMFEMFGLEEQVYRLMSSRVPLENGAYLIFDKTEALTAIDVNTGRFTGETALEDTVYETNLVAAREIARQVRLRNIGGIVIVDFIDMAGEDHRNAVVAELSRCLQEDRTKCNVTPMTELGLVQFTRKKVKSDKRKQLAVDFIKYYEGKAAREAYMQATGYVPIYTTHTESYKALLPITIQSGKTEVEFSVPNKDIVLQSMAFNTPGDWSYVENGNWIKDWSNILNSSVRDGNMTLTQFFQDKKVLATDTILKDYKAKEKYTGR